MNRILPFLLLTAFILSCEENEPIAVTQFSLPVPAGTPTIDRSVLTSAGSFAVGYANGNIRSNRVTLTWQRNGDADFLAYKVFRNNVLIRTIGSSQVTSLVDSNLSQNTYYKYMVAVLNQKAVHRQDTITIKTPRFQPPSISFQVLADTTLNLLWGHTAESATSYSLLKSTNGGLTFQALATVPDTFYNDRSVANLATYSYRIAASSPYETTATSISYSFTVRYLMSAPSFLGLQQLAPTRQVRVTWTDNSTAEDGFRVYRRQGLGGTYAMIGTASTNATAFTDADTNALVYDSTYFYQVQAYNQRDTSARYGAASIVIVRPAPRPTWEVRPPQSMLPFTSYAVAWNVGARTFNTRVFWFGAASGSSLTQSGPAGTTYSATLNFSTQGSYFIYANYVDSLGISSYQTDTVAAFVSSGGSILNEGFEVGSIPINWTTGGSGTWYASTSNPYSGFYSARSGAISASQITYLQTTVPTGTSTISFFYRVSSESGYDYLRFYINGSLWNLWSGESGWQFYSTTYTGSGPVVLRWEYSKDNTGTSGQDAAWIDNVVVQ